MRKLPSGFDEKITGRKLLRDEAPGTQLLYECARSGHNFLTLDVGCDGEQPLGPVGYIWTAPGPGKVSLYACSWLGNTDNFASVNPSCEGVTTDGLLGYVLVD